MAQKENKGGMLSNAQVEEDNKARGKEEGSYAGAQDTGDRGVRGMGSSVQQRDGQPEKGQTEED